MSKDKTSLGRSKVCPYKEGETASDRHERRLNGNIKMSKIVSKWCEDKGITVKITNHGHHWAMFRAGHLAEWWPSSAKLVFNKQFDKGIHCHDVHQLIQAIDKRWKLLV